MSLTGSSRSRRTIRDVVGFGELVVHNARFAMMGQRSAGKGKFISWTKLMWARRVITQYNEGRTDPFPPEPKGGWTYRGGPPGE